MAIRVIIVDDHPIVRQGIRQALMSTPDVQVVAETDQGVEALNLIEKLVPDVVVLDLRLPDISGVTILKKLKTLQSPVKVLILSGHDDPYDILMALEEGAAGFLLKDEALTLLSDAVQGVAQDEQGWVSRAVSAKIAVWMQERENSLPKLTPRERDVLRGIVEGKTNSAIAFELGIAQKTVEKIVENLLQKLQVETRLKAAVLAVRTKII